MRKPILALITLVPVLIIAAYAVATSLVVTIPAIPPSTSPNVLQLCNPLVTNPGTVTPGTNGTVIVTCPSSGAMSFKPSTETPTVTLAVGYTMAWIALNGYPCNVPFQMVPSTPPVASAAFLNHTITFSPSPSGSQLLSGQYNYCLFYQNAPSLGLGSFTVTWSP